MSVTSHAVFVWISFMTLMFLDVTQSGLYRPIADECLGVCGQVFSTPCSCASTCVLYKNCCENITKHCPRVVEEGRKIFARQLTSEIVCEEYGYFVITSCPANFSNSSFQDGVDGVENPMTEMTSSVSTSTDNVNAPNRMSILSRLAELYATRPVEDLTTGILYKNVDVFYCNTLRKSNYTPWKVYIVSDRLQNLPKISDVLNFLTESPVVYMPPNLSDDEDRSVCFNEAVAQCQVLKELQPLCSSFISYVIYNHTYYRNRYCFTCNVITNTSFQPVYSFRMSRFAFSLTFEVTDKEEYDIMYVETGFNDKFTWRAVTCRAEDDPAMAGNLGCGVTKCPAPLELRYDRECWNVIRIQIGIGTEVLLGSEQEEDIYSKYFACAFETIFNHEVVSTVKPDYAFYPGSKRYIILSNINFYSKPMEYFKETPSFFAKLAIIGRTFVKYRDVLIPKGTFKDPNFKVRLEHKMFLSAKFSDSVYFKKMLQKGPFETTLTVCFYAAQTNEQVTCWEEPIYLVNDDLPDDIPKTPCFRAISRSADVTQTIYVLMAGTAVAFFFFFVGVENWVMNGV